VNAEALLLGVPDYLNIKADRHHLKALPVLPDGADSTMSQPTIIYEYLWRFCSAGI
jgi:hypothetical protein